MKRPKEIVENLINIALNEPSEYEEASKLYYEILKNENVFKEENLKQDIMDLLSLRQNNSTDIVNEIVKNVIEQHLPRMSKEAELTKILNEYRYIAETEREMNSQIKNIEKGEEGILH